MKYPTIRMITFCGLNFFKRRIFLIVLSAVALAGCVAFKNPLMAYYEPGSNAAILATSGGGSASGSPYWTFLNPAFVTFVRKGSSFSAGYKRFFVGLNIQSYLRDIPGYIVPEIDEKNLEIFYGFRRASENFAVGIGYYDLALQSGHFSNRMFVLYGGWKLNDLLALSGDEEKFALGLSLKNVGVVYRPDEYTQNFFSRYSSEKYALTYDCGLFYSYDDRYRFGFVGRNLLRGASLGIYDNTSAMLTPEFMAGGAFFLRSVRLDLRLDARLSGEKGFEELIPSMVWLPIESVAIMGGLNPSQVSAGISLGLGDFNFMAAYIYPYSLSDGFGDVSVLGSWRFGNDLLVPDKKEGAHSDE